MSKPPTTEELTAERNRLQRGLFWLLDEKRRLGIGERHRNYWRWKQQFDAALDAKRRFDDQWGEA